MSVSLSCPYWDCLPCPYATFFGSYMVWGVHTTTPARSMEHIVHAVRLRPSNETLKTICPLNRSLLMGIRSA